MTNPISYNNPLQGDPSSMGDQAVVQYYQKQALVDLKKIQYFSQLADVTSMPKNFGKKIKRYHYLPMLDDRNINDQGIDAAGVTIDSTKFTVTLPNLVSSFVVEAAATAAAAAINAVSVGVAVKSGSSTPWLVTSSVKSLGSTTSVLAAALQAAVPGVSSIQNSGNLYGSNKDIGTISGKLPVLSESGGRVNRVGVKRIEVEGSIEKFGFFDEYTQESVDFDTDAELLQHINREMIYGAGYITEDSLQIDLINSAGVIRYAGSATQNSEINATSLVTYSDLLHLAITLDKNRCPKQTTVITGTRMVDTKTIPAARVLYMGSELLPTIKAMKDLHNLPAFISVEKYAAGTQTMVGEVGAIDQFRLVVVPEMKHWAGEGALVPSNDAANYSDGVNYDVFPMLCVGDQSFTTIGFQTDGKTVKFTVTHKKPGVEMATRLDPYGETGFMSIKWYYGFMLLRPERLALIKTVARL